MTRQIIVGGVPIGGGAPVAIPDFTSGRWALRTEFPEKQDGYYSLFKC